MNDVGKEFSLGMSPEGQERIVTKEERLAGLADWVLTLREQVETGKLTAEQMAGKIARTMYARELQRDRYKKQALIDALTNLANVRAFEQKFHSIAAQCDRDRGSFGLIFGDVDKFKDINDTYGHRPAGDRVLMQVALILASNLRETRSEKNFDVVARIGGEEFAILLPGVEKEEDLWTIAERERLAVAKTPFVVVINGETKRIPVTMSLGGGIFRGGRGQNPEQFREMVDKEALYGAKNGGRNQTVILPRE